MEEASDLERRIAGIAALDQPIRRDLYRLLRSAGGWTTRDDAAATLGLARAVVAFHLDKLAEAGVVDVRFERTSGRQGPGAGRPAKLYRLAVDELTASIPARHYDLAGSLLVSAIAESIRTGEPISDCLRVAARAAGRQLGADASEAVRTATRIEDRRDAVVDVLARHGYQPEIVPRDEVALGNCPFHRLAEQQRELVCSMNLDFLTGLLDGTGTDSSLSARLHPVPGFCCVRIVAA